MKYCIFHIPAFIDKNYPSGSHIRPLKMIEAFKKIGYEVDVVMGYGKERKEQINYIKKNIKNGKKYDFLYSESSTMPTLLTEKHHLPTYPFLDSNFFSFCKKNNIKIGLFYRDIHWLFPYYREKVKFIKSFYTTMFYKYDLNIYKRIVDILYLPSIKMLNYIPVKFNIIIDELPPATDKILFEENNEKNFELNNMLRIFYVGGIGKLYNLEMIFDAVNKLNNISLIVCCRKNEWEENKFKYEKYLNNRIRIVHESSNNLKKYYKDADLLNLFVEPIEYWKFAMPVKLFEYLQNNLPIITTNDTAVGEFVKKYDLGWSIDYSLNELIKTLEYIYHNKYILKEKSKNIRAIINNHTWEARARKVAEQLSKL